MGQDPASDEAFSGFLRDLAEAAAEKHIRDQAMAAFTSRSPAAPHRDCGLAGIVRTDAVAGNADHQLGVVVFCVAQGVVARPGVMPITVFRTQVAARDGDSHMPVGSKAQTIRAQAWSLASIGSLDGFSSRHHVRCFQQGTRAFLANGHFDFLGFAL
ncbi:MAG: hypothetical protein M1826_002887 [Phylliscum demangeonii]|nr:MAG: hypothetical protein M1826_002887 [Phylliscum demangeonii]